MQKGKEHAGILPLAATCPYEVLKAALSPNHCGITTSEITVWRLICLNQHISVSLQLPFHVNYNFFTVISFLATQFTIFHCQSDLLKFLGPDLYRIKKHVL